ncbi:MAG: hypothetical protein ACKVU4_09950 [Phycisphaerales bacterium]
MLISACVGCSGPVARRPVGARAGNQGSAWEVVLDGARLARVESEPETGRLNERLNHRADAPVTALDSWPERARPSVDRPRRVYMTGSFREYLYFRPGRGPR